MAHYFYTSESEQFTFYRIPKLLITAPAFKGVSTDAKILYGLMLDRMQLSIKNNWVDKDGRVFIVFKSVHVQGLLKCGNKKAARLFAELNGIGLIEIQNQGVNLARHIYVLNFSKIADEYGVSPSCQKDTPGSVETTRPVVSKGHALYNEFNKTDFNENEYLSINQDRIDKIITEIQCQIDFEYLREHYPQYNSYVENIVSIMAEIYLTDDEEITISKQKCSINYVRERFKKITDNHILWVIHNILETRSEVRNMKAYLLAALYNAPLTADIGNRQRIRGIVLRKFDGLE